VRPPGRPDPVRRTAHEAERVPAPGRDLVLPPATPYLRDVQTALLDDAPPARTTSDRARLLLGAAWLAGLVAALLLPAPSGPPPGVEPLGVLRLAGWCAALALLLGGAEPLRATRWAWFWLLTVPYVGVPAFLLLSGPTPGLPGPRPGRHRLTGGWAFLLSVLLAP